MVKAARTFAGEDWTRFNRLHFRVRPDYPGWTVINLRVYLLNQGSLVSPDPVDHTGITSVNLERSGEWNDVYWEIPDVPRDHVTGVEFELRRQGHQTEASNHIAVTIADMKLELVDANTYEGWAVERGRFAYSQSGYRTDGPKVAIASNLDARTFRVVSIQGGRAAFTGAVRRDGGFAILDFSKLRTPGNYRIEAGKQQSDPFPVTVNPWLPSLAKALQFFQGERCGIAVPGVHDVCHRDWQAEHDGKRIAINGGWHDAGDLSQGTVNTAEAVYTMFRTAEALEAHGQEKLAREFRTEAEWGLKWLLKTRFPDGHRPNFSVMGLWTDGVLGNNDDIVAKTANVPFNNFHAAAAEAAGKAKEVAALDWQSAVDGLNGQPLTLELAAAGTIASAELAALTGEAKYRDEAVRLAQVIVHSQQQTDLAADIHVSGFFYTDETHGHILHYLHRSHEDAPVRALARMCALFPKHSEAEEWRGAIRLYAGYLKAIATYTAPYQCLPASIYHENDALAERPERREAFLKQVRNGISLGHGYYLRRFPVWFDFRGNYGVKLSQTLALAVAAAVDRDEAAKTLAERQLEWVVGMNPFAQSTMYGEGTRYPPLYSAMSGDLMGALPVGVQTRMDRDEPFWSGSNYPNWKEVWVHTVARWMAIVSELM